MLHNTLKLDLKGVDILIHSGDATNHWSPHLNEAEFFSFLEWYSSLDVPYKIYVAGNHDAFIATYHKEAKQQFKNNGIIYLNKSEISINGIKIYGDPTTPTFGAWYFMASRDKIQKHWDLIPDDTDILVTHTPPKGILDIADNQIGFHFCGCGNLFKQVVKRNIKLHCFGHIHSGYWNFGLMKYKNTLFSNGSCVEDRKFSAGCVNNGNLIIV